MLDEFSLELLINAGLSFVADMNMSWKPVFTSRQFNTRGEEGENLLMVKSAKSRGGEVAQQVADHLKTLNADGFVF